MNQKEFRKYLDRDLRCWHCGSDGPDLVPHHRLNRGMGGSKLAHRPANIIVMCAAFNQAMEADTGSMFEAVSKGWKIATGVDPSYAPVYDAYEGKWFVLDDDYGRFLYLRTVDWD